MKTYIFKTLLVSVLVLAGGLQPANSQTGISTDTLKKMMLNDWERAKSYTDDYLSAMPASKYNFRPNDSIRTFAQQMLHLAQANTFFIMSATGKQPPFGGRDLEKVPAAQSIDSVKYYVDKSYDFAIEAINATAPSALIELVPMNLGQTYNFSRYGWMLKAFEHQTHHRGQTTIYLRAAGAKPPQERLF